MILTVTLNPAVDVHYRMAALQLDNVNRVANGIVSAGGNGINSARVLTQLGTPALALGLAGGPRGTQLNALMAADRIPTDFTSIAGNTRQCLALLHGNAQTEVLEAGPRVSAAELDAFIAAYRRHLVGATGVILAGNLPPNLAPSLLTLLIIAAQSAQVPVFLDVPGPELKAVLQGPACPTLIKPNHVELADLLDVPVATDQKTLLAQLQAPALAAVPWVLVSRGRRGALARCGRTLYQVTVPQVTAVNAVGSGDATTAGIADALSRGLAPKQALAWATACGTVNAMQEATGSVTADQVRAIAAQVSVSELGKDLDYDDD